MINDLIVFVKGQLSAAIFGILLLIAIIFSYLFWNDEWVLQRYDGLFLYAVIIQIILIVSKVESIREASVIILFHISGTIMEIFKTSAGSWSYPEEGIFKIAAVPLFSGFMYSSVGSYIARCWRIYDLKFERYPNYIISWLLALAIYINFFSHHYIYDFRVILFLAIIIIFGRTNMCVSVNDKRFKIPLILWFAFMGFLLWIAENMATFSSIWLYPHQQEEWSLVKFSKAGSWFLLIILSFVMTSYIKKDRL